MEDRRNIQLRLLSFVVIAYMLMAFTWWSVLLFTKNRDAFMPKRDLIKIGLIAQGIVRTDEAFLETEIYQTLQRRYRNQEWMILGEASVFVLSLVMGIWFINRGIIRRSSPDKPGAISCCRSHTNSNPRWPPSGWCWKPSSNAIWTGPN
ncbi:MAG: hypothetical protein IPK21_05775 [Haliscomenobacter sp.]|nr:hypothetical protein [Haliscomenobacter sp.]